MARYRSGTIQIDISDYIDAIDDDLLLEEVRSRKLSTTEPGDVIDLDIVREAYAELQRGRLVEARSILDRLLNPKWSSRKECESQYAKMI